MENGVHLACLARRIVFAGVRVLAVKLPFSGRCQEGRLKENSKQHLPILLIASPFLCQNFACAANDPASYAG